MKFKKSLVFIFLLICLFSIAGVCASDADDAAIIGEDASQMELSVGDEPVADNLKINEEGNALTQSENDDCVGAEADSDTLGDDVGNYSGLSREIGSGGKIELKHGYYAYDSGSTINITVDGSVIDGKGAVIDMAGSTSMRAFYVAASDVLIKNLTIKNARFDEGNGAAVYFAFPGAVTNCNFTNNTASGDGGAIMMWYGSVENCNFLNNTASERGGAIRFEARGNVINCNFTNNTVSKKGGAVYFSSSGNVTNSIFTKNIAKFYGGAINFYGSGTVSNCNFTGNNASSFDGGAVNFEMGNGTVSNCNFVNNLAVYRGGSVNFDKGAGIVTNCYFTRNYVFYGAGVYIKENGFVSNCTFVNNSALDCAGVDMGSNGTVLNCNFINNTIFDSYGYGGALSLSSNCSVVNCNFTNNTAINGFGGAVYLHEKCNLTNCNFFDNKATGEESKGGAVYIYKDCIVSNCEFAGNNATLYGGAICFYESGTAVNCNFVDNQATADKSRGGAIYFDGKGIVKDCNFTGNKVTGTDNCGGGAVYINNGNVTNCNFENNTARHSAGALYLNAGNLTNCNFVGNQVNGEKSIGGAVYLNAGNVTNCNFVGNQVNGVRSKGGAVYFNEIGGVANCNFTDNKGIDDYSTGGAVYFYSGGSVTNCNFAGNSVADEYTDGGAVYFNQEGTVTNSIFTKNMAKYNGGAVYFNQEGAAVNCNFTNNKVYGWGSAIQMSSGNLTNCNFVNSIGYFAGSVYISGNGNVTNCNFVNGTATSEGGAIHLHSGTLTNCNFTNNKGESSAYLFSGNVTNCNFVNNAAPRDGGAVRIFTGNVTNCNFVNNTASRKGGAIYSYWGTAVTNCNFTGNSAPAGSAIYFYNDQSFSNSVSNSCLLNNRADADNDNPFIVNITGNKVEIIFVGQDNLINAIYSDDSDVSFSNVTYWGVNGIANTDSAAPVKSNREAGQNITVGWLETGKIMSRVLVTDEEGKVVAEDIASDLIVIRHYADSYYAEAEKIITNLKFNVNVTSQTTTNRTVNITAKSDIPNEIVEGKLFFILPDGTKINASYLSNGTWWAIYTFDDYSEYDVDASFIGLDNVTFNNGTINVIKANSTIKLDNITMTYGDSINLDVATEGAIGIIAKIGGRDVAVVDNYTIPISGLNAGNYTLTVTTLPDADHGPVTSSYNINVVKAPTEIIVGKDAVDMNVHDIVSVNDSLNPAVGDLIYVCDNEAIVYVIGGKLIALGEGTATVTVSFAGNDNYLAAENKTITVRVSLKDARVSVENSTLELKVGDEFDLNATADPDALDIEYVSNNVAVATVDSSGKVTAVGEGVAVITVTVGNGATYVRNSTTVTVNVGMMATEITSSAITTVYNVDKYLIVNLKDANGNPMAGASVTVDVNGAKTYVTDNNGQIKVSTNGLVPKAYTVKITFNGNAKYAKSTKDVKVTVKKATPKLTAKKKTFKKSKKVKKYSVTLKSNTGKAMKKVKVTLKIKGKKAITVKTNAKGKAIFKIKKLTKKGTYKATVTFKANNCYNKVVKKVKIRIK